jgi:DNA replication factor GINS
VASTGQTPPATGGRASETTPEPSGDRPAAEAAVATGVEEPPDGGDGTDTVGGPETPPPAGETTGSPAVTDESGTGDAPTENGTATGDAAAPAADALASDADASGPDGDTLASDADASATGGEAPPAETDTPAVERSTVRVTDDVGEVFGVDDRAYELAASDVVHLPQMVAEPLVEQGVAEQL